MPQVYLPWWYLAEELKRYRRRQIAEMKKKGKKIAKKWRNPLGR